MLMWLVVPGLWLILSLCSLIASGRGICFPVIKSCVFGSEVKSVHPEDGSLPPRAEPTESSTARQVLKLLFCAAGLQVGALCMCAWPSHSGWRDWKMSLYCQFLEDAVLSLIGQGWKLGHSLSTRIIHQGCWVTFEGPFWCCLDWDLSHLSKGSLLHPWTGKILGLRRIVRAALVPTPIRAAGSLSPLNTQALFWVTFWG